MFIFNHLFLLPTSSPPPGWGAVCVWFGLKTEDKRIGREERGGLETNGIRRIIVVSGMKRGGMRGEPGEGGEADRATALSASKEFRIGAWHQGATGVPETSM